jgi:hypothetical protein
VLNSFSKEERLAYDFSSVLHQKGRTIYDTLMQVEYPPEATIFPWMKKGPRIAVKELAYDHLTQTITVQDQTSSQLQAPTLRSFDDNEFLIYKMYIEGYTGDPDVFIGERPPAGLATLTMEYSWKG